MSRISLIIQPTPRVRDSCFLAQPRPKRLDYTHTTHIHPHTHHTHTHTYIQHTYTSTHHRHFHCCCPPSPQHSLAAPRCSLCCDIHKYYYSAVIAISLSCIDRPLLALPSTLAPAPSRLREVVAPPLVANSLSHHRLLAGTVLSTRVSPSTVSLPISIYVDISKKKKNHHDY